MNTDHWAYVRDFLANPRNRATKYEVKVSRAQAAPGQPVWRVRGVWHLLPAENQGKHNIYVEVVDEQGNRINLARILVFNEAGARGFAETDKPANEPGTNTQMGSNETVKIRVGGVRVGWELKDTEIPSDTVENLHTRWADEPGGNTLGHHSYFVVFQRSRGPIGELPDEVGPPPEEPPGEPPTEPPARPLFSEAEKTALRRALGILLDKLG